MPRADVGAPLDAVRPAVVGYRAADQRSAVFALRLVELFRRREGEVRLVAEDGRSGIVGVVDELPLHVEGIAGFVRDGHVEIERVADVEDAHDVRIRRRVGADHRRAVRVADDGEGIEVGCGHRTVVVVVNAHGKLHVARLGDLAVETRAIEGGVGIP